MSKIYDDLTKQFDETQTVTVAGQQFTVISGEQVTSRLNEVLGFDGWSFTVKEHGIHEESDTCWALGRLEIYRDDGTVIAREQFGSQQIKRFNANGKVIDLANDMMGAATGSLKKCASLIGVGLYLRVRGNSTGASRGTTGNQSRQGQRSSSGSQAASASGGPIPCGECNEPIAEFTDAKGKVWAPHNFATYTKGKYGQPLCYDCWTQAAS